MKKSRHVMLTAVFLSAIAPTIANVNPAQIPANPDEHMLLRTDYSSNSEYQNQDKTSTTPLRMWGFGQSAENHTAADS